MDAAPPNDPPPQQQPPPAQQLPYTFPVQQQALGSWTPSATAAPFYPSHYFNSQWAYHQMMLNAHHHAALQGFNGGTPPPQSAQRLPAADQPGFHPYRRPHRHPEQQHSPDWRSHVPPYAHPNAANSSSSLSSHRQRTNSNSSRNRSSPNPPPSPSPSSSSRIPPHHRNPSSSSSATSSRSTPTPSSSSSPLPSPAAASSSSSSSLSPTSTPASLAPPLSPRAPSPLPRSECIGRNGLKGRIRRAFSFSALKEDEITEEHDDDESIKASTFHSKRKAPATPDRPETPSGARTDDGESTVTVQTKKKSRAASLFNSRLNASTDNISLSSTVSSASVMIRKLGSMSKLVVRRNSLAGITSIFKDKNKETPDKQKKKDKKAAKSPTLQAEVSHVHAELDRVIGADANGLSPAAELARQHTLKTKAEAAAKAKAQQEAQVAVNGVADAGVPAWDKNTTTRAGSPVKHSGGVRVNEDGTRVVVEEEDDDSDDGHYDPHHNNSYNMDGWDDDEDEWDVPDTDEDLTIRIGMGKVSLEEHDDVEPWAMDARRSVERTRIPKRGILKNAGSYDQASFFGDPSAPRIRSNSCNSHPGQAELGPLARIPSPDPDHIDGLHRHNSHSSSHSNSAPSIPPLKFDTASPMNPTFNAAPKDLPDTPSPTPNERPSSIFQHPALNSSAPALSMVPSTAPTLTHRSATAPAKKLAFATSLSVYDTFSSSVYDRRSEPATWSRLTPALAQRIKEELNSYKMEEMEVHSASRIHTQFFV
ncbi:hypothetical protein AGABI1DRAFT_123701 [Agaricus bisporus var. burnettii JB137-S8]|uniref:Uncharacterized protein n=1 Tax=Agaricus bisporus var. burnettii (strain JB137-S8 / ATCC MYA-4627 / FGSC 10392) TaxID=597362 RepID=K5X654_AGABU|nr:uncharacterized protein AGABI1DRAFT_123701 [Agaricus bisporus var. burnettii JB137-S8]EKM83366.1 hypothetical protein AGABI1DRAFT_123701 [Agaricus bisporus var. burnettii JB137-S8]